ncbi:hypothetical protein [Oricola sp.]|uniref:hypothetical protein n=1 Tax=Oricola sp. TaxID=1979950 RepID=UPI0025FD2DCB|nr:hypothetical protein [Oricola sp.]MCI5075259.1 hypothetical protein [Oricola sp.]
MVQLTKDTLFKPTRSETKMSNTDMAARSIADKEADARTQKTARLRALRLAKEAEESAETPEGKRAKAGKGRARRIRG